MKLNNKQTALVVKMIYDKIKEQREAQHKQDEKEKKDKIRKIVMKSKIYAQLKTIFSTYPAIVKVEVSDKILSQAFTELEMWKVNEYNRDKTTSFIEADQIIDKAY